METKIRIGTAYYPEHWQEERWEKDVQLMRDAGIQVVRLAELAWAYLEPEDGVFDFSWLDRFIALAYKNGIETVLGTPTEITPTWMNSRYPDIIAVNREGRTQGGRGNHCYNSRTLNFYVNRIVKRMAEHYRDNPAVIGWQLDNEIRGTKCYCSVCRQKYRDWLRKRYHNSIDELNREWGTCFWSQVYHNWEEVELPGEEQLTVSTSQILDHFRFASDSAVGFLARQADIIKKIAPHQFVSHNSLGLCEWVNLYDMGKQLDVMGLDSYPYIDDDNYSVCMAHDLARATKNQPYWIWEQKNGFVNYHTYNLAVEPGLVRLWTWQDIARGANGVVYYRWRSNRYGYEQNPNGILRHDGSPRKVYEEIAGLCTELKEYSNRLATAKVEVDGAILYSYEQMWDEHSNRQYKNVSYQKLLEEYYRQFSRMGLTVDLADAFTDLERYPIIAAPGLAVVNQEMAAHLEKYVREGGCLILGIRSGIKTWSGAMTDQKWPGFLSELAGIQIDEFEVLPEDQKNTVRYEEMDYEVGGWLERLKLVEAQSLAVYRDKFYAGETAVSKRKYGKGTVFYVGAMECGALIGKVLRTAAQECSLSCAELPEGVFMTRRSGGNERFRFLINKNPFPVTVHGFEGNDILTGSYKKDMEIPALDLVILHEISDGGEAG